MSLGFILFVMVPVFLICLIIWDYEQEWENMYGANDWSLFDKEEEEYYG